MFYYTSYANLGVSTDVKADDTTKPMMQSAEAPPMTSIVYLSGEMTSRSK
jgi:hypothetical protein